MIVYLTYSISLNCAHDFRIDQSVLKGNWRSNKPQVSVFIFFFLLFIFFVVLVYLFFGGYFVCFFGIYFKGCV